MGGIVKWAGLASQVGYLGLLGSLCMHAYNANELGPSLIVRPVGRI